MRAGPVLLWLPSLMQVPASAVATGSVDAGLLYARLGGIASA